MEYNGNASGHSETLKSQQGQQQNERTKRIVNSQRNGETPDNEQQLKEDEGEKKLVVPLADTVGHPEAVVVEPPNTLVTIAAVARSHRSLLST